MSELRWNPLLRTWTMVATNRQNRPNLPTHTCPFCPGSDKVPDNYEVFVYPNDFPVLSTPADIVTDELQATSPYKNAKAHGQCKVVLYSPKHEASLYDLSPQAMQALISVWIEETESMRQDPLIQYIHIFENRGEAVGVTIHHPHGQIYGHPYIPLKINTELDSSWQYHMENANCLICDMTREELGFQHRIVAENESFVAYIPYFSDYPFGVFIVPHRHFSMISDMSEEEQIHFGQILQTVTAGFDALYNCRFPYMMSMHQGPVNNVEFAEADVFYHFHVEFYTPWRDKDLVKYYAASETGAWAAANTRSVEFCAMELREKCQLRTY
jgi:UDPglucose--hexose-1-phosphate uridylyltransferase